MIRLVFFAMTAVFLSFPTLADVGNSRRDDGSNEERAVATATQNSIFLKMDSLCLLAKMEALANGEIACQANRIQYSELDCKTGASIQSGETVGQVECPGKRKLELRFKVGERNVVAELKAKRKSEGRAGFVTKYSVVKVSASAEKQGDSGPASDESSPVTFKFSGFATLEWEVSKNFGFDGSSSQTNFDSRVTKATKRNLNFLTNLGIEASRDATSLVSLFEIGEVYYGDTNSGGGVGARATNVFEVRNLYLNHALSESIQMRGGIVSTASDPRSFIFNDHLSSVQASFKTNFSEGLMWYGDAAKSKGAAAHARDRYYGLSGSLGFLSGLKANLFGVHRRKDSEEIFLSDGSSSVAKGDSTMNWAGATLELEPFSGFSVQGTGISSWVNMKFNDTLGKAREDSFMGYLADMKLSYAWGSGTVVTSVEGLATSGARNVTDSTTGKQIQGKRANFVSPVAATYLLTVATSDGVDDAPGTPKESIIANLNQDEGLRILVASVNVNLSRKDSGFLRYGYLRAANGSAAFNKTKIGSEIDLGFVRQLSPSTSLQFDYGYFQPGDFYIKKSPAQLAGIKAKFVF